MTLDQVLEHVPVCEWHGPFDASLCRHAIEALESGKVLVLPLGFPVREAERRFLDPASMAGARKNISLDPRSGRLGNSAVAEADRPTLVAMMQRFADSARRLLMDLLPRYADRLERARTSFRPAEIAGRNYSPRHDDRLLHVDAFPSRPVHGRRILRLFTNVAPDDADRIWHVGEPFVDFAQRFLGQVRSPLPGYAWVLRLAGLTKGRRSAYDHVMLGLHDAGKRDSAYQLACPRAVVRFAAGTTWLCFTDQVLHAALAGHCALEQTFHVPVDVLARPDTAPLRVLQRMTGRGLGAAGGG